MQPPLARLSVHTITTKPWSLRQCVDGYRAAGVAGITVWRQALQPQGVDESRRMLADSGLTVTALCRGGFFVAPDDAGRQAALDDNRRAIDEARAIGAPMVVLVCGARPEVPIADGRRQVAEAIAAIAPHARAAGVRLAIEPLHPMYADTRSAITTLRQARLLCAALGDANVGVAVDVYHVWWDPDLEAEIAALGAERRLFALHLCDWIPEPRHLLNDRGLPGEGCARPRRIRALCESAGFAGFNEIEIFSDRRWAMDQGDNLRDTVAAYLASG
ncbi:MAG TPA: sugar phosphate isomerase/epimerase family protein [Planctomycetota bacterium]|nr:sugar phosphate isomerase/epimerase family protein [Planctomycetota bacterium]